MKNVLIALVGIVLAGCSWMFTNDMRTGSSSSLVDFLYPDGQVPPEVSESIPEIRVPARVGIAFVPTHGSSPLSAPDRRRLLEQVREAFIGRSYVERIEVIPDNYLQPRGGFDSLQQVARLHGVDLVALVSYDQVAFTEDTNSSLLYWTIVGAYVIQGSSNETRTFVDTAVFDLGSRQLLFRAPGSDTATERSTAVGAQQTRRELAGASFERAMAEMTVNLDAELERFRERIKRDQSVRVVSRDGGEAGSLGAAGLLLLLLGALTARRMRARHG